MSYWVNLEKLVSDHEIVIDRLKSTSHPKYPDFIYPIDYGYLKGTTTIDGNGVDIFIGSKSRKKVEGIICTVDLLKNDTEIKIMYGCYKKEINMALKLLNAKYMSAIFVKNSK